MQKDHRLNKYTLIIRSTKPSRQSTGRFGVFDFIQDKFRFCSSVYLCRQERGGFGDSIDTDSVEDVVRFKAKQDKAKQKPNRTHTIKHDIKSE